MGARLEMDTMFSSTGQAVHFAFLVTAQEAMQDAPLRKVLIGVMESKSLEDKQRRWLDRLRGQSSGSVNLGGLNGIEVRAQCAMITQAVRHLPQPEMWSLQARYGQAEFEDVIDDEVGRNHLMHALDQARTRVQSLRTQMEQARIELDVARDEAISCGQRITQLGVEETVRQRYQAARDVVRDCGQDLALAESKEREAQIALDSQTRPATSGPRAGSTGERRRRFAFSAERIEAIKGLSEWFQPQFPGIKPLAFDCMLGRLYANHSQVGITFRDLAQSFGGSAMQYYRASCKLKSRVRELEQKALARLEERLARDGVVLPSEIA